MRRLICAAALVLAAGCGEKAEPSAQAPLRLALDFIPNAVHAPVYAAAEAGHVELLKPGPSPDSLKLVLGGRADVGLLDIHDFALALEQGRDLVAVAALVQKPLASLAVGPSIKRPADLEGKRVGVSGLPSDPAFVKAIVQADGGDFSKVKLTTIGFAAVQQLLQRNVDGVPVFWNAEGVALTSRGWKGRIFKVEEYGAPVYPEVVVFTTGERYAADRAAFAALKVALQSGIERVRADPAAFAAIIAKAADAQPKLTREQLDAVLPLFGTTLDRRVIEEWARFDERIGIVKRPLDLSGHFVF